MLPETDAFRNSWGTGDYKNLQRFLCLEVYEVCWFWPLGTVGDKLVKKGWVRKGLDLEEQGVNYWGGREAVNTDAQGFALLSDLGSFCSLWTREAGKKK